LCAKSHNERGLIPLSLYLKGGGGMPKELTLEEKRILKLRERVLANQKKNATEPEPKKGGKKNAKK